MTYTNLIGWMNTLEDLLFPRPAPKLGDSLQKIILANNKAFGPSPITGGIIHRISAPTALIVATVIDANAPIITAVLGCSHNEAVALLAAGIKGESRFDPRAINPNKNKARPNETPAAAFGRHDLGLCQFSARVVSMDADNAGLSPAQIQAECENPAYAVPRFARAVAKLLIDAHAAVATDPTLLEGVPNRDPRILAFTGYNAGETGAKTLARANRGMPYGQNWVDTAAAFLAILNG